MTDHLSQSGDSPEVVIKRQRREIAQLNEVLHRKNLELDALHMVWCDGGCRSGVHRWTEGDVTEELVATAERNTERLRRWFTNRRFKEANRAPDSSMGQSVASQKRGATDGSEAVARICDHMRKEGIDPDAATVLSFVTWEEIVRVVVTSAGAAGVLQIEWPEEAEHDGEK